MPAGKENRNTIYSIEFDRLNDDMRMVRNRVPTDRESVPTHFTRSYIRLCAMYDSARRVCTVCVCAVGVRLKKWILCRIEYPRSSASVIRDACCAYTCFPLLSACQSF